MGRSIRERRIYLQRLNIKKQHPSYNGCCFKRKEQFYNKTKKIYDVFTITYLSRRCKHFLRRFLRSCRKNSNIMVRKDLILSGVCCKLTYVAGRVIEVVITSCTRNAVVLYWARGFESHTLRQKSTSTSGFAVCGLF